MTQTPRMMFPRSLFHRVITLVVMLALIANPVLALPLSASANGPMGSSLSFASFLAQIKAAVQSSEPQSLDPLERPEPTIEPVIKGKNKEDQKSKVSKLESSLPNKIELQTREKMNFFAVPVDNKKKALQGLEVEYQSTNPEVVFVNKQGQAIGGKPGVAEVIVSAGTQQLRYQVTVIPSVKPPKKTEQKIGSNSGRAKIYKGAYSFVGTRKIVAVKRNSVPASAAAVQGGTPPPSGNHAPYAIGNPPLKTEPGSPNAPAAMAGTERPGSANFSFNAPLFNLPGRGQAAALDLFYNSRLWNHNGIAYFFDEDKNWLAPGFSLGYGKMIFRELGVAGNGAGFTSIDLITSDGTHHELFETGGTYSGIWETTDGTFIKFVESSPNTWMRSYSYLGTLIFPNGTRMEIGAGVQTYYSPAYNAYYRMGDAFPTKITDRNGNYINVNYASGAGPKIDTIVDSLNRYVRFYYNAQGDLFEITTPAYASASERDTVRFFYQDLTINPSFSNWGGSQVPTPNPRKVIRYIFYPGTNTGYKYDYSTYGMIYKTTQLRGMQLSGSVSDPNATVSNEGQIAATTTYNYPTGPSSLSDIPKFTTRTDNWAGNTTGGPVVTTFSDDPVLKTSMVIAPDGTETITTKNSSGQVSQTEIKKNGVSYGKTVLEYSGTQITRSTTTNDKNQSKITEYGYTTYNNVSLVIEKDFSGVEVRRTETTYETGSGWLDRRLLHLPKTVLVKNAAGTVVSRTEFTYDNADTGVNGNNLTSRGNSVVGFDQTYNPYAPAQSYWDWVIDYNDPDSLDPSCYWNGNPNCDGNYWVYQEIYIPSPYNSANAYRGNVTKAIRYAKPAAQTEANASTYKYDVLGNLTEESASCCRQRAYNYIVDNHYSYPAEVIRGAVGGTQLTNKAIYDFNTGLVRESYDENNQKTTFNFYADSLRIFSSLRPDNGQTKIYYYDQLYNDPDAAHQHSYVRTDLYTTATGNIQQSLAFYDGAGRPVRAMGHHYNSGSTTYRSITDMEYDAMGRVNRTHNPYYGAQARLSPISNSAGWTSNEFDPLGRITALKFDSSGPTETLAQTQFESSSVFYVETITDQAGKQRRRLTDGLGRLIEVHEPDANGNLGTVSAPTQKTQYQYDVLDNIVKIAQGNTSSEMQERYFKYDGLSRLTHERHVEQAASHYEVDSVSNNNYWSKKITYDLDGKVTDSLDARGTNTHFTYDTLNRVIQMDYSGGTPTVATPTVTYKYDEIHAGYFNLGKMTEAKTSQLGAIPETKILYDYDLMGRVKNHQQIIGSTAYTMGYEYNVADQLTKQTYPSGRQITYTQTNGVGLTAISDSSQTYASDIRYSPHGVIDYEILGYNARHTAYFNARLQLSMLLLSVHNTSQDLQRYTYYYGQYDTTNTVLDESKNNGQIAKIESHIAGIKQWEQRHTYDTLGRLTIAGEYRGDNGQLTWRAHFGYDRFGNRYQNTNQNLNYGLSYANIVEATTPTNGDIDKTTNRFRTTTGIAYDNVGNVTADSKFKPAGTAYSYDATNRVVASNYSTAVYDGGGQRVQATEAGATTTFVYDAAGKLIAEYSPLPLREYIYRGSEAIAKVESSTVRYYWSDHLGSKRVVLDASGGVIGRYDYQPFGEEIGLLGMRTSGQGYGISDSMRIRYAGIERGNGLDHTLFRKVENKSGRWNGTDPYNGSLIADLPQSFNRFCYSYNDPQNFVDRDGAIPLPVATAILGGIAGALGSVAGQVISNKGFSNFSWKAVGIAAATGAVAGALAPYTAAWWVAGVVGGVSNTIQYDLTKRYGGAVPEKPTPAGYLFNFAVGFGAGAVFGRWTAPQTAWGAGLPGQRFVEGNRILQQLELDAVKATNLTAGAFIKSTVVNSTTNSLPADGPTIGSSRASSSMFGGSISSFGFSNGPLLRRFEWLSRAFNPTPNVTFQATFDCVYDTKTGRAIRCTMR